jgi:hypothetical protein
LSAGGTVAASESAKPGDLLFPVERAVERTQLAFASSERATELRAAFAAERFAELQAILEEEGEVTDDNPSLDDTFETSSGSSTDPIVSFSAEADVFTDITVVIVERNDTKRIFTTSTTTKEGVVAEIASRYDVDIELIEATLDFEIEDRASRPSERGTVLIDNTSEVRVSKAVNVLLDQLEELDDSKARDGILTALMAQINKVEVRGRGEDRSKSDGTKVDKVEIRANETSRVKIDDDRVEIREDGYRIRIDADGDIKVKVDDDRDDSHEDDDNSSESRSSKSQSSATFEIEADVYTDITLVKVEINDKKSTFSTTARTRAAVAAEVADRYGISVSEVEAALDLEIEDRSSRGDQEDNDKNRDSDDGRDGEDDDHDSQVEDDNSGRDSDDENDSYIKKAEVRVEKGRAEVRVEYNGRKLEYETLYTTRAVLVAEIAVKTGLLATDIDAVLDIEID